MINSLSTNVVILLVSAFVLGLTLRTLIVRGVRFYVAKRYKQLAAKRPYRRENGSLRYQINKEREAQMMGPIEPPPGTPPDAAERFAKLSPLHQRQAVEAMRRLNG